MTRKLLVLALSVMVLFGSIFVSVNRADAGSLVSQAIVLNCQTLSGPITFQADRDNTGTGAEHFIELVTDGVNTLFVTSRTVGIGGQDTINGNASLAIAQYNPITYRLYSPEGNGQPEQVLYTFQISCGNLIYLNTCTVPDAGYQAQLTGNALLYWNPGKPTEPNVVIPGGRVVMVYSVDDDGWAKIKWSCGVYYVKASLLGPNSAAVSKPFIGSR